MFARCLVPCAVVLSCGLVWLALIVAMASQVAGAQEPDEPTADPPKPARRVQALAGNLERVRPMNLRRGDKDLLNKLDLARDVVYTTTESPVPESEQFQFVDGVLRTPEKGDARLCLPVEVPEFYRLLIDTAGNHGPGIQPTIGIGSAMNGYPFFVEMRSDDFSLSRLYDQKIAGPLFARDELSGNPATHFLVEVFVGDCGILLRYGSRAIEFPMAGPALSIDPKWEMPEADRVFLTIPAGQVDIRAITFDAFSREQWLEKVTKRIPKGSMVYGSANVEKVKVRADVEPLPDLPTLRHIIRMQARMGDFDELERWTERLRTGEVLVEGNFVAENIYDSLARTYVTPSPGSHGLLDVAYQSQFAFISGWLKQKPDSVAARIVKARTYVNYAWDVGVETIAQNIPGPSPETFKDRMGTAEQILNEAAALKPRDACVFSSLMAIGDALHWKREQMDDMLAHGLEISTKNSNLVDCMTKYLLQAKPGDLGKFALSIDERIKGDDGLDAYARVALVTQTTQVHRKRWDGVEEPDFDFTDPSVLRKVFSADKLRAIIPVLRLRHGKEPQAMNYVCWLLCVLDDREPAKNLFALLADKPDLDVWEWRDKFDHWRHWADPSIAEPSVFLPIEGEEIAHFQAYCDGAVEFDFLTNNKDLLTGSSVAASTLKVWRLDTKLFSFQFGLTEGHGTVQSVHMLGKGVSYVRMQNGEETLWVEYVSRGHEMTTHCPTNFCGPKFNLIADNLHAAAILTDSNITVHNDLLRKRETVPMPKLKSASFSPNGDYLLGTNDKIHVWDGMGQKELFTLDVEPKLASFMQDGTAIVYVTDDKLVVWDIAGNRKRFSVPLDPRHQVQAVTSTHDGRFLAAAEHRSDADGSHERNVVAVYDLKQAEPVHVFDGHKQAIVRLAIARDDGRLASSSTDGVVKVWDLATVTAAPDK